jgi:hypothetical protein
MKKKKMKELIQGPLRFHHQDIHEELDKIKNILNQLSFQVVELKKELAEVKPKPFKSTGCVKCGTGTSSLTS